MTNDEVRTPSTDTRITNKENASTDTFHEHESNEYESHCQSSKGEISGKPQKAALSEKIS